GVVLALHRRRREADVELRNDEELVVLLARERERDAAVKGDAEDAGLVGRRGRTAADGFDRAARDGKTETGVDTEALVEPVTAADDGSLSLGDPEAEAWRAAADRQVREAEVADGEVANRILLVIRDAVLIDLRSGRNRRGRRLDGRRDARR